MCRSKLFYLVALSLAGAAVLMTFTGLPSGYDTEPLLAIGLLFLALGCIDNECCKPVKKRR